MSDDIYVSRTKVVPGPQEGMEYFWNCIDCMLGIKSYIIHEFRIGKPVYVGKFPPRTDIPVEPL